MVLDVLHPPSLSMLHGNLETGRIYAVRSAEGFVWLGWAAFTELSDTRIALDLRRGPLDVDDGSPLFDLILDGGDRARLLHDRGKYLPCLLTFQSRGDGAPVVIAVPEPRDAGADAAPQVMRFDRGGLIFGSESLPLWVGPTS